MSVEDQLRFDDTLMKVYHEIMAPLRELVRLVRAIACGYDEIFRTQFQKQAIDYSTWPNLSDRSLSLGDALRIEVGVLRSIAADARWRLDSLEGVADAAVDLVRREMDGLMAPRRPDWLIDESCTLAKDYGFDPVSTVFACLPVVTTIDKVLKKPLDQIASYPNDVPLRTWFNRNDTCGLAALLAARDALLTVCVQIVSGLLGASCATDYARRWVQRERHRREGRCVLTGEPRARAHYSRFPFVRVLFPCFAKLR